MLQPFDDGVVVNNHNQRRQRPKEDLEEPKELSTKDGMHHPRERTKSRDPSSGFVGPKGKVPSTARKTVKPTIRDGAIASDDPSANHVGVRLPNSAYEELNGFGRVKRPSND